MYKLTYPSRKRRPDSEFDESPPLKTHLIIDDEDCWGQTVQPYPTYSNGLRNDRFSKLSALVNGCSHLELIHLTSEIQPLLRRDFIRCLPFELSRKIFSYLKAKDLLQCAQVRKCTACFRILLQRSICVTCTFAEIVRFGVNIGTLL